MVSPGEIFPWLKNAVFYQIFVDRFAMGDTQKNTSYITCKWGDIPNSKTFAGGDLKDNSSILSCNLFLNRQKNVSFVPENGMMVLCFGYIDVYEKNGTYQLYITSMQEVGKGNSQQALEELKKKLSKMGIFDKAHKKKLPHYPRKIGIVTSKSGAAFADLRINIERRWPLSEIVIAPCLVQGENAPSDIVKSICFILLS